MSLHNIFARIAKVIAFVLSAVIFFGCLPAMADIIPTPPLKAKTDSQGKFSVSVPQSNGLPLDAVVRSAILSLPNSVTGTIENIKIIDTDPPVSNPSGLVFGCVNIRAKNNTNLIKECGGPAQLKARVKYRYQAIGSGFKPDTEFEIKLYNQFNEGEI